MKKRSRWHCCILREISSAEARVAIKDDHILMADDLELFNRCPWGRVAYQLLVANVRSVKTTKGNCTVGMSGLVYTLLAWAYEVILALSSTSFYYAKKTSQLLPRILNWDSDAQLEWRDLLTSIFKNPTLKVNPIVPSD